MNCQRRIAVARQMHAVVSRKYALNCARAITIIYMYILVVAVQYSRHESSITAMSKAILPSIV